jgi:hypothetical protein
LDPAEFHEHSLSLYFANDNFMRVHNTLRASPAVAAGMSDRLRSMGDFVRLTDQHKANEVAIRRLLRLRADDARLYPYIQAEILPVDAAGARGFSARAVAATSPVVVTISSA